MASQTQGTFSEANGSPHYEYGSTLTCTRIYFGSLLECQAAAIRKGNLGTGDMAGWMVETCVIDGERAGVYRLTLKFVGWNDLPLDEYSLDPFEINPKLERHPRYQGIDVELMQLAKYVAEAPDYRTRKQSYEQLISTWGGQPGLGGDKAVELAEAWLHGQDSYYLPGLKYVWSSHYRDKPSLPAMSMGGIIETPDGPLSDILPSSAVWLRECDKLGWTGTVFKVTRTWVGAPQGHWNENIYSPQ